MAELTAVAAGVEAGPGTHRRRRGGNGDPRRPAMKKTTVSAMERVPGHLARRGRCGRRGGASRLGRRARGGRWPRQRRTAAVMALGCARERAGGEEEGEAECKRGRGSCVASPGASRRGGERAGRQGGWWRGAAERARVGHAPVLLSGRKTTEEGQWAGPALAAGPARPHRSWAVGKFLLFISFSIFLTYVLI